MAAALAKKHLQLPVTLITDKDGLEKCDADVFDSVLVTETPSGNKRTFKEGSDTNTITWKNFTRANVYELSPYDQTLLIDCDFFINSDNLLKLFDTNSDFLCHKKAHDFSMRNSFNRDENISSNGMPMLWATVIYFTKSDFAKAVFTTMEMVKEHYNFYAAMHGFNTTPYRNDYALTIAHSMMSGHTIQAPEFITYNLGSLPEGVALILYENGLLGYVFQARYDRNFYNNINKVDIHIMNKKTIMPFYDTVMEYAKS